MSKPDVDQAAFPSDYFGAPGMTLRDYFAGQFLASMASSRFSGPTANTAELAYACYRVADAMLAERAK